MSRTSAEQRSMLPPCLEHLAKACLVSRSQALLTELKNEKNFSSLLRLLGIPDKDPPIYLRTVGRAKDNVPLVTLRDREEGCLNLSWRT